MNTSLISSSSAFIFDAEHNGVPCIASTRPEDQGTNRQFWFTVKMLCEIFEVAKQTLTDNLESLVKDGEVAEYEKTYCAIPGGNQRFYETAIYNLEVLNKLGMCCFRGNKKAREIRNKFNDILVKEETKQNTLPVVSKEDQFLLSVIHAESKEETVLALKDYKNYRDEQQREIEQERDEAIRTKAFISSKREATAMATAKAEKAKRIALEERIGEGTKWMSSAQLIKNYNIMGENGKLMNSRSLTLALKKRNCTWRQSDVPDSKGYLYTIFLVSDAVKALKLD